MLAHSVLCFVMSVLPQQSNQSLPDAPTAQATAARPNPDAEGVYHFEKGVVSIAELVYSVEPEFPAKASKRKLSASPKLRIVIDTNGTVIKAEVIQSAVDRFKDRKDREAAAEMDQAAIKTVKQYKFKPGMFQGKPVLYETTIEINFQMF